MRSQVIYSHGDPGTFDITDKDNPLYYIARYCHECSEDRYELNADGFKYEQMEPLDMYSFHDEWGDMADDYATWMASAVAASEAGTSIPALPTRQTYSNNPCPAALTGIAIEMLIRVAMMWLRKKLDSDTDSTEIAQVLKRAFLDEDGEGDEYALIKQMANTPLEIVVSKADGFEDISYADRPET